MRRHRQAGVSLILLSSMLLMIIAIAALLIDINQAYYTKQRMQRAADQASIAAGVWLPDMSSATNSAAWSADLVAKRNGAKSLVVSYPAAGSVRVAIQSNARYFFAPFFGMGGYKVVSGGGTTKSRGGKIVPLGIRDVALTPGKTYIYNYRNLSGGTLTSTNWVALSIGGAGKANFTTRLENSYNANYPKGKGAGTESKSMITPAKTGIVSDPPAKAIFQQASKAPWFDTGATYFYPFATMPIWNPRVVMVARVVQPAAGKTPVTINRFGSLYLRNYNGGTGQLTFVWLGDFTATAGNPVRGWFQTNGLTFLSQ